MSKLLFAAMATASFAAGVVAAATLGALVSAIDKADQDAFDVFDDEDEELDASMAPPVVRQLRLIPGGKN
jgi:hypothetical protein